MDIVFLGIPVSGDVPETQLKEAAVSAWLSVFRNEEGSLPELATLQALATREVYRLAEARRAVYITTSPGKIGEYAQKRWNYDKWTTEGQPDPPAEGAYPIAEAESAAYNPPLSVAEMLQTWGERSAAWELASAAVASAERAGLVAVAAAVSEADIMAALVGWPWTE